MGDNDERCARCGKVAEGYAFVNDERFCHGDYTPGERTCYMEESYRLATGRIRTRVRPIVGDEETLRTYLDRLLGDDWDA